MHPHGVVIKRVAPASVSAAAYFFAAFGQKRDYPAIVGIVYAPCRRQHLLLCGGYLRERHELGVTALCLCKVAYDEYGRQHKAQQRRIRHRQQRQPVKRKACKEYRRCKHRRCDKPRMLF